MINKCASDIDAKAIESLTRDTREMLRLAEQRAAQPTAVIMNGRTLQSTPESGSRADYYGQRE